MSTDGDVDSPAKAEPGAPSRRSAVLAALVVLCAPLVGFLPAVLGLVHYAPEAFQNGVSTITKAGYAPGLPYIDPNVGFNSQALGHAAAEQWLHGQVPWWNHLAGAGMPLAASSQTASFLPLTLLQALSNGSLWFHIALSMCAGISMLLLLRAMRCSLLAASAAAIAFELGGAFAWLTNAAANPVAFVPLCMLGIELISRREDPRPRAGVVSLAVGTWLTVVAGFPEVTVFTAGLAACWLGVRMLERPGAAIRALGLTAAGGVLGALLAAPMLNASIGLMRVSNIGGHVAHLSQVVIPKTGLAQFVSPYLWGGIFESADKTVIGAWQKTGGYAGVALLALAVGALVGGRDRWLRWVLGAWALLWIGSSFNAPVLHTIVARIPGLTHVAVFRYATASSLFCLCVLAARCIDDLRTERALRRALRVCIGLGVAAGLLFTGLRSSAVSRAWTQLHLPTWYKGSLLVCGCVAAALVVAVLLARWRTVAGWLVALVLAGEAVGAFAVPILAWPREFVTDTQPVAYLSAHLGPQRFYTTKPVNPNWGSYYGIASLDAADLPIATVWSDFVHSSLNDNENPWQFGIGRTLDDAGVTTLSAFVAHMPSYQLAGTKFLLVPRDVELEPYLQPRAIPGAPLSVTGATVKMAWRPPDYLNGGVLTTVVVAMPLGIPEGLATSVCSGATCSPADPVTTVQGGTQFALRSWLHLSTSLSVSMSAPDGLKVTVLTVPVSALTGTAATSVDGARARGRGAVVRLVYDATSIPRVVKLTPKARIYQVPNTVPLASAPGCTVATTSLTTFRATCAKPSTLTYHQLDFPGWSATVNGAPASITRAQRAFQSVALPAGASVVTFDYRPPGSQLAWAAMALGLIGTAAAGLTGRRKGTSPTVSARSESAVPRDPADGTPSIEPGPSGVGQVPNAGGFRVTGLTEDEASSDPDPDADADADPDADSPRAEAAPRRRRGGAHARRRRSR